MIVIGYCSPATDPGATCVGGAVSMIVSVLRSRLRTQLAFTPQTTSAVVQVSVPMQVAGGPACVVGWPRRAVTLPALHVVCGGRVPRRRRERDPDVVRAAHAIGVADGRLDVARRLVGSPGDRRFLVVALGMDERAGRRDDEIAVET